MVMNGRVGGIQSDEVDVGECGDVRHAKLCKVQALAATNAWIRLVFLQRNTGGCPGNHMIRSSALQC